MKGKTNAEMQFRLQLLAEIGRNIMDEAIVIAPDSRPEAATITAPVQTTVIIPQSQADAQTVRTAAALGWALVELLGRCFTLPQDVPSAIDWDTGNLMVLPENRTPREKLRALVGHIVYLADLLDVSSFIIERKDDEDVNRRYVDVLSEEVALLSQVSRDPAEAEMSKHMRGQINERLFFWDEKIYDAFQNRPVVVYKAYMAGRGLASLRWYFGLQNNVLEEQFLQNLCGEYLRVMSPYLPAFIPGALTYTVNLWGNAIIQGQVEPGEDAGAPPELQRQADLWYSLVTGAADPLSHIDTSKESKGFIWKVLRLFWPLVLAGIIVFAAIIVILAIVILSNHNIIVTGVTAATGLLTLLGTYHSVATNVGSLLQKAASQATSDLKGSLVDSLWNSTQQKEVNKGLYIPPAGIGNSNKSKRVSS